MTKIDAILTNTNPEALSKPIFDFFVTPENMRTRNEWGKEFNDVIYVKEF